MYFPFTDPKIEPNAVDILEMVNKHLSSVIPRKNFGTTWKKTFVAYKITPEGACGIAIKSIKTPLCEILNIAKVLAWDLTKM